MQLIALSQSKPKPIQPTSPPTLSHAQIMTQQCTNTISACRKGTLYTTCFHELGCPNTDIGKKVTEACKTAVSQCEGKLIECIDVLGPNGCTPTGWVDVEPIPSPTPKKSNPSPFTTSLPPAPSPSPIVSLSCASVIDRCKMSTPYLECMMQAGCQSTANMHTEVCQNAYSVCVVKLKNCVFFYGSFDCQFVE